jgi:hypothetical protein
MWQILGTGERMSMGVKDGDEKVVRLFFFGNESNCERREAVPTVGITSYLSRLNAR